MHFEEIFDMRRRLFLTVPLVFLMACDRTPVAFLNTDVTGATFGRQLSLADHHGRQRTLADFGGKVVVVFFGYTSCPDICPTMLSKLAEVMQALGPAAQSLQVLFVTLDPERDSAERLKEFVPWFHPSFLGLRGDAAQTRAAAEEFRVFSARKDVGSGMGYVLDHSSGAYVFDPAGRLRLYVKDSAQAADIVADIRLLLAGR
jgi:protein SCO1/2